MQFKSTSVWTMGPLQVPWHPWSELEPLLQALGDGGLPKKLRMVVLCNKPSFEFRAFQVSQRCSLCEA